MKQPNTKTHNKNISQIKGFNRWGSVSLFGKTGVISKFTGSTSTYVVNIHGEYIKQPNKSYKQVSLGKIQRLFSNQDKIAELCVA